MGPIAPIKENARMDRHKNPLLSGSLLLILLCAALLGWSCRNSSTPANNNSAAAAATSSAGGDFEGSIAMKVQAEEQKNMQMTYFLKGKQTRIDRKSVV